MRAEGEHARSQLPLAGHATLWRRVFLSRHLAIASLAVLALVMPEMQPRGVWIALALACGLLPYSIALDLRMRRTGHLPRAMPYLDQAAALALMLAEPLVWTPALLVMVANLSLIVVAFGWRVATRAAAMATVGLIGVALVIDPAEGGTGVATYVVSAAATITIVSALSQRVRQYADIVEAIGVALVVLRADDHGDPPSLRIIAANPATTNAVGQTPDALIGRTVGEAFPDLVGTPLLDRLAEVARGGAAFDIAEVRPLINPLAVYAMHVFPLPGSAVCVALEDVTDAVGASEALRRQALHDDLTGLPNRTLLRDRLAYALQQARRSDERVALLLMDLNQFKEVNDALGHHHGDRLLIELSRRLQEMVRECDTIARLGGDEFALLLTTDAGVSGATRVAEKVIRALEQPITVDGLSLQTHASIGIALYPDHAATPGELTQRADVAMYMAKRNGTGHALYDAEHDRSSVRRLRLLGELRRAIRLDELRLHYQPSYDLRSGRVAQLEALVRWQHPVHGLMGPGEFIELAEVSGMIQPLTRWVVEQAVGQLARWRAESGDVEMAVNLSVRNLYDAGFDRWLEALLDRIGVPGSALTVEITESEIMDDPLLAMDVLGRVKSAGVTTSIDDFGTGYSSLSNLRHLPIDAVKIDRSFVGDMSTDEGDATIVRAIVDLGHNLGLTVVAEGVEDEATLAQLVDLGCDRAQGFHLGRPVPADEVELAPQPVGTVAGDASTRPR